MRDTITESKNNTKAIIVIVAFLMLVASIALGVYSYRLEQKAVNIYSDIIEVKYNNKEYVATVKYTVNDQEYTKIIRTKSSKEITLNDKIKIAYDKDNPKNLINNTYKPIVAAIILVIAVIVLVIFAPSYFKMLKRKKTVKRIIKDNMFIIAPISEIIIDTTKKVVNDTHSYKLRSKFLNKADNKEYIYESDSVYIDLNKIIQETRVQNIKIYIDKLNTNNYYVDLESLYPDVPIIDPLVVLGGNKKDQTEEKKVDQVEEKAGEENTEAKEGDTKSQE